MCDFRGLVVLFWYLIVMGFLVSFLVSVKMGVFFEVSEFYEDIGVFKRFFVVSVNVLIFGYFYVSRMV